MLFCKIHLYLHKDLQMQTTNNELEKIIPQNVLFNLAQLQELNILKTPTAKKLIYAGKI